MRANRLLWTFATMAFVGLGGCQHERPATTSERQTEPEAQAQIGDRSHTSIRQFMAAQNDRKIDDDESSWLAEFILAVDDENLVASLPMTEAEYSTLAQKDPAQGEQVLKSELEQTAIFRSICRKLAEDAKRYQASGDQQEAERRLVALQRLVDINKEHESLALWGMVNAATDKLAMQTSQELGLN